DPFDDRREDQRLAFGRLYARYARRGGGLAVQATAWVGVDETVATTSTGPVRTATQAATPSVGARAWVRHRLSSTWALQTGVDALVSSSTLARLGSLALPPREGDRAVFGAVPADDENADRWATLLADVAPFVTADVTWGAWTVSPGLRVDGWALSASRKTPRVGTTPSIGTTRLAFTPDPRVAVLWKAAPWLSLRAAGGLYHQPPPVADTSAVFGAPTIGLERALHLSGGGQARVVDGPGAVDVDVTLFYRLADGLVTRVPSSQPPLAGALANDGVGVAAGATLSVRRALGEDGAFGWLAYTLSRSVRQDDVTAVYRLADFDQTHVLTAVAAAPLGPVVASLRARAATGMPRPPVVGAVYDARRDRFEPVLGPHNTSRLPPFFQVDARVEHTLVVAPFAVDLSLELLNITLRDNAEEVVYDADFTDRAFVTGVPFLAVAGARVRF
ncbi:MAG: TonB-dependent receptor, partial [Deltaproteobacteria bacterium]|nr:TonB-dependent receptor [Deltaproteobacteria bacterium]